MKSSSRVHHARIFAGSHERREGSKEAGRKEGRKEGKRKEGRAVS